MGDGGATQTGSEDSIVFAPFWLDPVNQRLWRDGQPVELKPRAFAVLCYLLERANRLVTKQELLCNVWGGVHVGAAVLKTQLRDIRQALGDQVRTPRFIETFHRRGYRFIAPVRKLPARSPGRDATGSLFVGRQSESSILLDELARALTGCRRAVFVTGHSGIGKTSLVRAFCERQEHDGRVLVAWGQCAEQHGPVEAYLPLLEAIARIGRGRGRDALRGALRRHAPSWLPQLPSLQEPGDPIAPAGDGVPAAHARMLREMAEALEAISLDRPIVLLLEDLHWADPSTLAWIAYVAHRTDRARLLLIATHRPLQRASAEHPLGALKRELDLLPSCAELAVPFFSRRDVAEYLSQRFGSQYEPTLPDLLLDRTAGNPFFLVKLLDSWLEDGQIRQGVDGAWQLPCAASARAATTPPSIVALIEKETDALSSLEQSVLQAASVAGFEFSSVSIAAALAEDLIRVEEICLSWARRGQFIRLTDKLTGPDGTVGTRCEFIHALYQQSVYECIGPTRQARLHLAIGNWLESTFGEDSLDIAAELGRHFERGRERRRAFFYLRAAGDQAARRNAYEEAIGYYRRGLELLRGFPDRAERLEFELSLSAALAALLAMTRGYSSPEVEASYTRMRQLCQELGEAPRLARMLPDIISFYLVRGAYRTACEFCMQSLRLQEPVANAQTAIETNVLLGVAQLWMGKLSQARLRLEQVMQLHDPDRHRSCSVLHHQDTGTVAHAFAGVASCLLGFPDQGLCLEREALALAQQRKNPCAMALATTTLTLVLSLRGDFDEAARTAEAGIELCAAFGLRYYLAMLQLLRAANAVDGADRSAGVEALHDAWRAVSATGSELGDSRVRCLLARAYARTNRTSEAFALLAEALLRAEHNEERVWESEIYRTLGELALNVGYLPEELASARRLPSHAPLAAEVCFARALALARTTQAKLLELHTALSLARLWRDTGKVWEAYELLLETHAWFVEGFTTSPLGEAARLLNELAELCSSDNLTSKNRSSEICSASAEVCGAEQLLPPAGAARASHG